MSKVTPTSIRLTSDEKAQIKRATDKVGMDFTELTKLLLLNATSVILSSDGDDLSAGSERFSLVWRTLEGRLKAAQAEEDLKKAQDANT